MYNRTSLDTSCKRNKGLDNQVKNKNYSRNHTFLDFSLLCFLLVEAPIETMLQWPFILHLNERYNVICWRKGIKQPLSLRVICNLLSLFPFITTLIKLFTFFPSLVTMSVWKMSLWSLYVVKHDSGCLVLLLTIIIVILLIVIFTLPFIVVSLVFLVTATVVIIRVGYAFLLQPFSGAGKHWLQDNGIFIDLGRPNLYYNSSYSEHCLTLYNGIFIDLGGPNLYYNSSYMQCLYMYSEHCLTLYSACFTCVMDCTITW